MEAHTIFSGLTGAAGAALIQGAVKIYQSRARSADKGDDWARSMVESMIAQERQRGAEERAECSRRLDLLEAEVRDCREDKARAIAERAAVDDRLNELQSQHNELREILDSITPAPDSEPPPRGGFL
jgi:chromosome segregation ATPase